MEILIMLNQYAIIFTAAMALIALIFFNQIGATATRNKNFKEEIYSADRRRQR